MRAQHSETSESVLQANIEELMRQPVKFTALGTRESFGVYSLYWTYVAWDVIPETPKELKGLHRVIVNTSDWERFREIVARVIELRKRKPATAAQPIHIARTGRR